MTDDEIERELIELAVDEAFLKLHGKTYREKEPPSAQAEGDSLAKVMADFPELFGGKT